MQLLPIRKKMKRIIKNSLFLSFTKYHIIYPDFSKNNIMGFFHLPDSLNKILFGQSQKNNKRYFFCMETT